MHFSENSVLNFPNFLSSQVLISDKLLSYNSVRTNQLIKISKTSPEPNKEFFFSFFFFFFCFFKTETELVFLHCLAPN